MYSENAKFYMFKKVKTYKIPWKQKLKYRPGKTPIFAQIFYHGANSHYQTILI